MTAEAINHVYYDPWDAELNADPYPMFKRLRDDAPLYYNEPHDFYALSRFDDVNQRTGRSPAPSAPPRAWYWKF